MTWFDHTFRLEAPAEVSPLADGAVEMSWPAENGSRLTVIVPRGLFASLVGDGERLLAETPAPPLTVVT